MNLTNSQLESNSPSLISVFYFNLAFLRYRYVKASENSCRFSVFSLMKEHLILPPPPMCDASHSPLFPPSLFLSSSAHNKEALRPPLSPTHLHPHLLPPSLGGRAEGRRTHLLPSLPSIAAAAKAIPFWNGFAERPSSARTLCRLNPRRRQRPSSSWEHLQTAEK